MYYKTREVLIIGLLFIWSGSTQAQASNAQPESMTGVDAEKAKISDILNSIWNEAQVKDEPSDEISRSEIFLKKVSGRFGARSSVTLQMTALMGSRFYENGSYEKAGELLEEAVVFSEDVLGKYHPERLQWMINLASALKYQGDLSRALTIGKEVLSSLEQVMGPDSPITLIALNNLAETHYKKGNLLNSQDLTEKLVSLRVQLVGPDHFDTLRARHYLSLIYFARERRSMAMEICKDVLARSVQIMGENNPWTIIVMSDLAMIQKVKGDLKGAIETQSNILKIRQSNFGIKHFETIQSMVDMANLYKLNGELRKAKELEEEALYICERALGAHHVKTLDVMRNLAATMYNQGLFADTQEMNERILSSQTRKLGEGHPDVLPTMIDLARALFAQRHLSKAQKIEEKALEISRKQLGFEHPRTLDVMANLTNTLHEQGYYQSALALGEDTLELRHRVLGGNHLDTLASSNQLAIILRYSGALTRAREVGEASVIKLRQGLGPEHPDTLAETLSLANTHIAQGHYTSGRKLVEGVLNAYRRMFGENHNKTLGAKMQLAQFLQYQGDIFESIKLTKEILAGLSHTLGEEHPKTLMALARLGIALQFLGDISSAREVQEKALLGFRRELGESHPHTATTMAMLAKTLESQGDFQGAKELQEEVLEIRSRTMDSDSPFVLMTLGNLATTLVKLGDISGAIDLERKVLSVRRRTLGPTHPDTIISITNLASHLQLQGDLREAQALQQENVDILIRERGAKHHHTLTAKQNLAVTLKNQGHYSAALKIFTEVLAGRGEFYRKHGEPDTAERAILYHNIGHAYSASNLPHKGLDFFMKSLDVIEGQVINIDFLESMKILFRARYSYLYKEAIAVSLELGYKTESLAILERYRAQGFLRMAAGRRLAAGVVPQESLADYREVLARYKSILNEVYNIYSKVEDDKEYIKKLQKKRKSIKRERDLSWMNISSSIVGGDGGANVEFEVESAKLSLDHGTILLSYSVHSDETYLFVLSRDGPVDVHRVSISRKVLSDQLGLLYNLRFPESVDSEYELLAPRLPEASEARIRMGKWFYKNLVAPAAERISESDRVLIIPDGLLHYIPFGSLIREADMLNRSWHYFIEWKPLYMAASIATHASSKAQRQHKSKRDLLDFVAFADPVYPRERRRIEPRDPESQSELGDSLLQATALSPTNYRIIENFRRLPYSGSEVNQIGRLFELDNIRIFLREEANEKNVQSTVGDARVVHFAVHGMLDSYDPSDAFLALSGRASENQTSNTIHDGILQAWEISQGRQIEADLVVLSACTTALGHQRGGEGAISLSRAFQIAGANSVVASLWKINDISTAKLMVRFYRHLRAGKSKDKALQAAQIELIRDSIRSVNEDGEIIARDFSAPYYWAAFQLYGDWK